MLIQKKPQQSTNQQPGQISQFFVRTIHEWFQQKDRLFNNKSTRTSIIANNDQPKPAPPVPQQTNKFKSTSKFKTLALFRSKLPRAKLSTTKTGDEQTMKPSTKQMEMVSQWIDSIPSQTNEQMDVIVYDWLEKMFVQQDPVAPVSSVGSEEEDENDDDCSWPPPPSQEELDGSLNHNHHHHNHHHSNQFSPVTMVQDHDPTIITVSHPHTYAKLQWSRRPMLLQLQDIEHV